MSRFLVFPKNVFFTLVKIANFDEKLEKTSNRKHSKKSVTRCFAETSRDWEQAGMDRESGKIGEYAGASYYLLYISDAESDWKLDLDFLNHVLIADPNRNIVIYHEKFWMHREQLRNWEKEHGKRVRTMQIPFQMR